MATVSAVCTTLFLGGYLPPWPLNLIPFLNNPWLGPDLVRDQGPAADLGLRVAARHAAALPVRPVHGPRLEGPDPDLAGVDRDGRASRPGTPSALGRGARRGGATSSSAARTASPTSRSPRRPLTARLRRVRRRLPRAADAGQVLPEFAGVVSGRGDDTPSRPSPPPPKGRNPDGTPRPVGRFRRHVQHDVPQDLHAGLPAREGQGEGHHAALPRPAPAQPLARRPGEVRRLRAVRVGLPGGRDLRRGRATTPTTTATRPASATAASTRSTTCAASSAACASRPARRGR